jgi:hypothetical protein
MNGKTESAPSELTFSATESGVGSEELLHAIKQILTEGDSHNAAVFDKKYWDWQYKNLPTKRSGVYTCTFENKIAGYYHAPFYEGQIKGKQKLFAMVQDVAVNGALRGKGVFRKLADYATSQLVSSGANLIYTFPNDKSIHTFLKYNGYKKVCSYDTYILPVKSSQIIKSKIPLAGIEKLIGSVGDIFFTRNYKLSTEEKISVSSEFNDETASYFNRFAASFPVSRIRNKEYLNWRYINKPGAKHFVIVLSSQNKIIAAAVFKLDKIFGVDAAILLDFAFEEEKDLAKLIHYVRENAAKIFSAQPGLIFTAFCCNRFLKNNKYGFIKVPQRFNPRAVNLLVKNISEEESLVSNPENWFATLGDWDVF